MTNPNPAAMFGTASTATAQAQLETPVHKYPLPGERREYTPNTQWGKYILPHPETGEQGKFTRTTTGVHTLDNTTGLDKWKLRNVVLGIKQNPDLLENVDLLGEPRDVSKDLDTVADEAQTIAGAKDAAEKGTAIHAWIEAVETGFRHIDDVPAMFRPFADAYFSALSDAGITILPDLVERIVWNKSLGWVGTFDNVWELADGTRVIGDKKTSKDLRYSYASFAAQMACYADADAMLKVDGSGWEAPPAVGNVFGIIAHIPSDRPGHCELVTYDLEEGRRVLALAAAAREVYEKAGTKIPRIHEIPRPVDTLTSLINKCTNRDELSAVWGANQDIWTDEHTQLGLAKMSSFNQ